MDAGGCRAARSTSARMRSRALPDAGARQHRAQRADGGGLDHRVRRAPASPAPPRARRRARGSRANPGRAARTDVEADDLRWQAKARAAAAATRDSRSVATVSIDVRITPPRTRAASAVRSAVLRGTGSAAACRWSSWESLPAQPAPRRSPGSRAPRRSPRGCSRITASRENPPRFQFGRDGHPVSVDARHREHRAAAGAQRRRRALDRALDVLRKMFDSPDDEDVLDPAGHVQPAGAQDAKIAGPQERPSRRRPAAPGRSIASARAGSSSPPRRRVPRPRSLRARRLRPRAACADRRCGCRCRAVAWPHAVVAPLPVETSSVASARP